jgi:hypothetical protein
VTFSGQGDSIWSIVPSSFSVPSSACSPACLF